jgi:transposase
MNTYTSGGKMPTKRPVADDKWRIPDELWEQIAPQLPPERPKPKGGRPRLPDRQAMDAILFLARSGCQWNLLPRSLGASSTVHDRFQAWVRAGVFVRLWRASVLDYDALKGLNIEWQALDGAMTKAPLGGEKNGSQSDGSRQSGDQAEPADRWEWHPAGDCSGWRQSP